MKIKLLILVIGLFSISATAFFIFRQGDLPKDVLKDGRKNVAIEVIAENLNIPWDIAFLPDKSILVTERKGNLLHIYPARPKKEIPLSGVSHIGEGGLLGITLHPNFTKNYWLYLYITSQSNEGTINRVERYKFENDSLSEQTLIIDNIPGAPYHDGGRLDFGPDGFLYITTGDAADSKIAQDKNSLGGKILRLHDDGRIPEDNPFLNEVWSYGHRNPQGIAWDKNEKLWSTEHGPSAILWPNCCQDEVNLIEKGSNYGWPNSVGNKVDLYTTGPILHSGRDIWAPASAAVLGDSLFFGGLKGEALYEAILGGNRVVEFKSHFKGELGRIRTVRVGPDGYLYITTSNTDGRGDPKSNDDKIIKINPKIFREE